MFSLLLQDYVHIFCIVWMLRAHFVSYMQYKSIDTLSQLFNAHLCVMRSHLLAPVEFFSFGPSTRKHQHHLVINYSCLFQRIRTE